MATDKRTQARLPQSLSGGHGHVSGIGMPARSLVSAVPHASESRDGVSPKARLKSAPEKWRAASFFPGPRAQDEADHDADHSGCADPKADNPAKGGGFRKGLHHNLS
jgi:hypothetical protein